MVKDFVVITASSPVVAEVVERLIAARSRASSSSMPKGFVT
jgi:hypothetical protein